MSKKKATKVKVVTEYTANEPEIIRIWDAQCMADAMPHQQKAFRQGVLAFSLMGDDAESPYDPNEGSKDARKHDAWLLGYAAAATPHAVEVIDTRKKHEKMRKEIEDALAGRFGDNRTQDYEGVSFPDLIEMVRQQVPQTYMDTLRALYEMNERSDALFVALRTPR